MIFRQQWQCLVIALLISYSFNIALQIFAAIVSLSHETILGTYYKVYGLQKVN